MDLRRAGTLAVVVLGLSGCVSSSGGGQLTPGAIRVVNAVSDSSTLGANFSSLAPDVTGIAFGADSGFAQVPPASFTVNLGVIPAAGGTPKGITVANTPSDSRQETTVYATGTLSNCISDGSGTCNKIVVEQSLSTATNTVQLTFVDAASQLGSGIDVYAVVPGSGLGSASPLATLQYLGASTPLQIASGTYELIVTAADAPGTVVFDSGPNGIDLSSGGSLQIAALDAPGQPDGSQISLLKLDNTVNITPTAVILKNLQN